MFFLFFPPASLCLEVPVRSEQLLLIAVGQYLAESQVYLENQLV